MIDARSALEMEQKKRKKERVTCKKQTCAAGPKGLPPERIEPKTISLDQKKTFAKPPRIVS